MPWDPRKAAKNLKKHTVDFREAQTVIDGELTLWEPDATHDDRVNAIGFSSKARILFVVTLEKNGRIISARKATSDEEERYAEYLQDHQDS